MAKTVDQFSTVEDFRQKYNELAIDVGDKSGLRTSNATTVVDALNSIEDKSFYFQEFIYIATAGQSIFTGADTYGTTLVTRKNKIQVYKNGVHLNETSQYTATNSDGKGNFNSIELSSPAGAGDNITIYAFTGSYEGAVRAENTGGQFTETVAKTIYNVNQSGVILKGSSSNATTSLESGYQIQMAGTVWGEENLTLASGKTMSAPTITDQTLSINSGNITSGVSGTFSGALTAGSFTDNTLTITGGDITGVDDITGTADSTFTAFKFIDKSGANLTGGILTADSLDIEGNADINGIMEADAYTVDSIPLNEYIEDTVGLMVSSNTEDGLNVTYSDNGTGDGKLNFNVDDFQIELGGAGSHTTGSGTVTNLANVTFATTISDDVVDSQHYVAGSIDLEHMSANSVDSDQYVDGSIDLAHMSYNSIDQHQYVDGSIRNEHIGDDEINSEHYADESIDTQHIGNLQVTTAKIKDLNVSTAKIADLNVTTGKIAADAVTLGAKTSGDYVATIAGTANEVEVTGTGTEGRPAVVGLPNDVTIGQDLTVSRNATITGNLTVNGTTTTISTTNLDIADKLIVLGKGQTTLANTSGSGIQLGEHASAPTITWDNSTTSVTINKALTVTGFKNDANALADINYTSTPTAGQALIWDNSAGYWEPTTLGTTTDSYAEGSNNHYFIDDRVNDMVLLHSNAGLSKVYVDNADGGADSPIDGRITLKNDGLLSASNGIKEVGVNKDAQLDYEVVNSAPAGVGSSVTGHLWFVI
jgi:hypothetical protein